MATRAARTARLRTAAQFAVNEAQERDKVDRRKCREKAYHDVYEESKWFETALELYAERALWGSDHPLPYTKWRLDQVEGYRHHHLTHPPTKGLTSHLHSRPQRMRRKLVPDTTFWRRYSETLAQADVAVRHTHHTTTRNTMRHTLTP